MTHVTDWTRESLEVADFEGFTALATLPPSAPPRSPGVYMILRLDRSAPAFLEQSIAGQFKGVDSTVDTSLLLSKWVQDASVLYIGKARWGTKKDGLRRRLSQYRRHGAGKAVGHRGGEFIWRLADSEGVLVCWNAVPDDEVSQLESDLIREFVTHFGRWPNANRKDDVAAAPRPSIPRASLPRHARRFQKFPLLPHDGDISTTTAGHSNTSCCGREADCAVTQGKRASSTPRTRTVPVNGRLPSGRVESSPG